MLLQVIRTILIICAIPYLVKSLLSWRDILFPGPKHPQIPNLRAGNDKPYIAGLTRGKLSIGRPGSGKTEGEARMIVDLVVENEEKYQKGVEDRNTIFVLDASGSITKAILRMVYSLEEPMRTRIIDRILLDILGHPKYVMPFPFIHPDYETNYEEQVSRVTHMYETLNTEIIERTPIMALAIREMLPQFLRLLSAMKDENGDPAQIGEIKKLIAQEWKLKKAVKKFGHFVPEAKWYFEKEYFPLSKHEKELRSLALRAVISNVGTRFTRPRVNSLCPGWTPKEVDEKGWLALISGEEVINQERAQAILFSDVFTQILAHVNKRIPHDPINKPILLAIDEVPMLLDIKGFAKQISSISVRFRSRLLQIVVIIQALWQLEQGLKNQIWSIGNVTCYGTDDFEEAKIVAKQLFKYDPTHLKFEAAHEKGLPIAEQTEGQYVAAANWLQHLKHRECVMKKYITESTEEPFVTYVEKTRDNPFGISDQELQNIKEQLLKRRAIPIREALRVINSKDKVERPSV